MFKSIKPFLHVFLALSVLLSGQTFGTTEHRVITDITRVNIYKPTDVCSLIIDIIDANNPLNSPSIIDLGGQTFELSVDCANAAQAAACGYAPTSCFANGVSYAHGNTGLPEITGDVRVLNGRIVRSVNALNAFRIFTVTTPGIAHLSLFKTTLENGYAQLPNGNGGAIYVDSGASLSLQVSKIGFNTADDSGGGIYVAGPADPLGPGTLDVDLSIISHNSAVFAPNNLTNLKAGGGGIYLDSCAVLLNLVSSTISNNAANGLGGGLNNQGNASNIFDSTFSYNRTCLPVAGSGECPPNGNPTGAGGGIYNDATATKLELKQNTFWANISFRGGAIYNEENTPWTTNLNPPPAILAKPCQGVCLNNNTIANNTAFNGGGGIYNNPGHGVSHGGGFINQLVSNLIAANIDHDHNNAPDLLSDPANTDFTGAANGIYEEAISNPPPLAVSPVAPIFEGFNLVGDCGTGAGTLISPNCGLTNDVNWDIVGGSANISANIDPRIHDLRKNGGPTETVALLPDSPCVNNGFNNLSFPYDQRGVSFFRVVAQCDCGSYEYQYD